MSSVVLWVPFCVLFFSGYFQSLSVQNILHLYNIGETRAIVPQKIHPMHRYTVQSVVGCIFQIFWIGVVMSMDSFMMTTRLQSSNVLA